MRDFLLDRIRLVRDLLNSDIAVDYSDIGLILCTVIATCAERKWRGDRIDKKRFVELLSQDSPAGFHADWICVPALIVAGHVAEADTAYGPNGSDRIFTDDDLGLNLTEARSKFSNIGYVT